MTITVVTIIPKYANKYRSERVMRQIVSTFSIALLSGPKSFKAVIKKLRIMKVANTQEIS